MGDTERYDVIITSKIPPPCTALSRQEGGLWILEYETIIFGKEE